MSCDVVSFSSSLTHVYDAVCPSVFCMYCQWCVMSCFSCCSSFTHAFDAVFLSLVSYLCLPFCCVVFIVLHVVYSFRVWSSSFFI